jgi:hypothetical protein
MNHTDKPPILRDIALQFETERLLLRCPRPGDGPTVFESVRASLAALRGFPASMPWTMFEPSVDASEQYCRESQANFALRSSLPLMVFLKATGQHVGNSGLHNLRWAVP